jgi:hypothetical protein
MIRKRVQRGEDHARPKSQSATTSRPKISPRLCQTAREQSSYGNGLFSGALIVPDALAALAFVKADALVFANIQDRIEKARERGTRWTTPGVPRLLLWQVFLVLGHHVSGTRRIATTHVGSLSNEGAPAEAATSQLVSGSSRMHRSRSRFRISLMRADMFDDTAGRSASARGGPCVFLYQRHVSSRFRLGSPSGFDPASAVFRREHAARKSAGRLREPALRLRAWLAAQARQSASDEYRRLVVTSRAAVTIGLSTALWLSFDTASFDQQPC